MIKATAYTKDGRTRLVLGLSWRNLEELRRERPIIFDAKPYGFDGEIMIFAGETEQTMADLLLGASPEVKPQVDPDPNAR